MRAVLAAAAIIFAAAAALVLTVGGQAATTRTVAPGQSWDACYDASAPGDICDILAGAHPGQTITGTKADPGVTFQGAGSVSSLDLRATGVTFDGLTIGSWKTTGAAGRLTFRNTSSGWFGLWSADDVQMIGGDVDGEGSACSDPQITEYSGSRDAPERILIDGVRFHDWVDCAPDETTNHIECLQVGAGNDVTIRNSRFENCSTHAVFVRSWGGINGGIHPLNNWRFENNVLAATRVGFYAVQFQGDLNPGGCGEVRVYDNTLGQNFLGREGCGPFYHRGNTGPGVVQCIEGAQCVAENPPPPPPPPTTTQPPSTTTEPPPYQPACEPNCDQTIQTLTAERNACRSKLARINTAYHGSGSRAAKLSQIHTLVHEAGPCAGFSP
jgi:hypothetical protein